MPGVTAGHRTGPWWRAAPSSRACHPCPIPLPLLASPVWGYRTGRRLRRAARTPVGGSPGGSVGAGAGSRVCATIGPVADCPTACQLGCDSIEGDGRHIPCRHRTGSGGRGGTSRSAVARPRDPRARACRSGEPHPSARPVDRSRSAGRAPVRLSRGPPGTYATVTSLYQRSGQGRCGRALDAGKTTVCIHRAHEVQQYSGSAAGTGVAARTGPSRRTAQRGTLPRIADGAPVRRGHGTEARRRAACE
jgi:hypothetical protein